MCIAEPGCTNLGIAQHTANRCEIWSLSLAVMRTILDLFNNEATLSFTGQQVGPAQPQLRVLRAIIITMFEL